MSRGRISKIDMSSKIHKMKTELYDGTYSDKSGEWHDGAHYAFNKILDFLNEYHS